MTIGSVVFNKSYCIVHIYWNFGVKFVYTVVPAFNGPSDERTPAMAGHFLNVQNVLPC